MTFNKIIFNFFLKEELTSKHIFYIFSSYLFKEKKSINGQSQKLAPEFFSIMSDSQKLIPQNKIFLSSQSQNLVAQKLMSVKINAIKAS